MAKPGKGKQQTLEATLGRPRVRPTIKTPRKGKSKATGGIAASSSPASMKSSPRPPPASFLHSSQVGGSARKPRAVLSDDSSEEDRSSDDEVQLPVRKGKRGKKAQSSGSELSDAEDKQDDGDDDNSEEEDEDEEDDKPLVAPTPRRKRRLVADESDDDDEPLVSSPVKRRRLVRRGVASSPAKDDDDDEAPAPSSARTKRTGRKLTQKEKARELLRRKRAGEVINEEEEESSEDEEPVKGMYDTDSDHLALNEFEDDEEGVPDSTENGSKGKKGAKGKKKKKKQKASDDGNDESELDDFIVDDSDAPLGAPEDVYLNMPLEFTAHSHKPLKEHFRDAIEWLVQFKVNPGFSEKEHPLYRMAWKKLDDEVRGLATSKFASSAWKKDFYMALRARPYWTNGVVASKLEGENCGACGRSGHPASYTITFDGAPYYKDTTKLDRLLQPVEVDSDSGDDGDEREEDEDEDGNPIPKESKQWSVGAVCNSNAETAHTLIHWKYALLDWVDTRLHEEGYMAPSALAERERMRPKQKYKLVDAILEKWVNSKVVDALYRDFKGTLEAARNKSTTGRYR